MYTRGHWDIESIDPTAARVLLLVLLFLLLQGVITCKARPVLHGQRQCCIRVRVRVLVKVGRVVVASNLDHTAKYSCSGECGRVTERERTDGTKPNRVYPFVTLGRKGGESVPCNTASQSVRTNQGCRLMSSAPPRKQPSRRVVSAVSSLRMRSLAMGSTHLHAHIIILTVGIGSHGEQHARTPRLPHGQLSAITDTAVHWHQTQSSYRLMSPHRGNSNRPDNTF